MRYILHNMDPETTDYILAVRAAHSIANTETQIGDYHLVEFEDGRVMAVKVNKTSLSVWPQ